PSDPRRARRLRPRGGDALAAAPRRRDRRPRGARARDALPRADRRLPGPPRGRLALRRRVSAPAAEASPAWIFDADGHAVEPAAIWTELLPRAFRSYAPRVVAYEDHFRYACNGRLGFRIHAAPESVGAPGETTRRGSAGAVARGGAEPGARLEDMALDAIARAAIYPTQGLMIQGVAERAPALALCRAVNDWVADYCRRAPGRLLGIGTLPMADCADALDEARRCVERLGMRGVWRRPEHWSGIPRLHDPGHAPLFAYLAEAGVPLAIHP